MSQVLPLSRSATELTEKMSQSEMNARNERKHPSGATACVVLSAACAIPVVALIVDQIYPFVFERSTLEVVARARGESPSRFDVFDGIAVASCSAFLLLFAVLCWRRQRAMLSRFALAIYAATIGAAAIELVLRYPLRPFVYPPAIQHTFYPEPSILPGIEDASRFTTNRLGMRGPEWDDTAYRILCVGGSTTVCLYLDDSETWPQLVMDGLNRCQPSRRVWVGNVGKSGHDTFHHIELLKRLPEAALVDCCIFLCGVNDLEHALRLPYDVRQRFAATGVFDLGGPPNPTTPLIKQTRLYNIARAVVGRTVLKNLMEVEDTMAQSYVQRRQARQAAVKDYPLPDLTSHLIRYRKNLLEIVRLCRSRGVRCIFMTQPTLWDEDLSPELESLLWSQPFAKTGRAMSTADLARAMEAFNQTLREFCRDESVECVDLATVCPKDMSVFADDEHFNETGARLVSTIIIEHLQRTEGPSCASFPSTASTASVGVGSYRPLSENSQHGWPSTCKQPSLCAVTARQGCLCPSETRSV